MMKSKCNIKCGIDMLVDYKTVSGLICVTLLAGCSIFNDKKQVHDLRYDNELIIHIKDTKTQKDVGTVTISPYMNNGDQEGMLITPHLYNLPPTTTHGMHIHVNPSCADNGKAAGGHWDPQNTNKHLGPYDDNGHIGDLPVLIVNSDGSSTKPVVAPRLHSLKEIEGHSLMIHSGSDNYSDDPEPLGGGGDRMWCGVIGNI